MRRVTLDVNEEAYRVLKKLSDEKGATNAEVIRRALASYAYLDQETRGENGNKVSISDSKGDVIKDVILP